MSSYCTGCGVQAPPGRSFCTSCGTALAVRAPTARRPRVGLLAIAAIGVAAAVVVGFLIIPGGGETADAAPGPVPVPSSIVPAPVTVPTPTRTPDEQLEDVIAADAAQVNGLSGSWVAQVSSKAVGTKADGIVYDEEAIVALHERLGQEFGPVLLLRSSRFANFSSPSYYVSVMATPYSTPTEANAWCDRAGIGVQDCFATRLVESTAGVGRTVVHR